QSPASRPSIMRSNDPSFRMAAASTWATVNGSGLEVLSFITRAAASAFIARAFLSESSAEGAPKESTVIFASPNRSRNCNAVSSAFSQKIFVTRLALPRSASRLAELTRNSRTGISGSRICLIQTRMFMRLLKLLVLHHSERGFLRARFRSQQPIERDFRDLFRYLFLSQGSILPEPARQPANHSQQTERCRRGVDILKLAFRFERVHQLTQPVEVITFTTRDDPVLSRRQRGDLIDEYGDCSLSAGNELRMTTDDEMKTLDRIG